MTEYEHRPWTKVIVHEVRFEKLENFLQWVTMSVPAGELAKPPLKWCNGWILVVNAFPSTPSIVEEKKEGILRFQYLGLAPVEKYKEVIELDNRTKIPVINVSSNPFWTGLIDWVTKEFEEEIAEALKGDEKESE